MPPEKEKRFRVIFKGLRVTVWNPATEKEETFLDVDAVEWGNMKEEGVALIEQGLAQTMSLLASEADQKAKKKKSG